MTMRVRFPNGRTITYKTAVIVKHSEGFSRLYADKACKTFVARIAGECIVEACAASAVVASKPR